MNSSVTNKSLRSDSMAFKYALSCCGATVAETVTYPLDLVKTRLQIQGERSSASLQYRGMFRTAQGIVQEEGLRKLWQGIPPALYRHLIYTGCRLSFYEIIRDQIFGKNPDGTFPLWKAIISSLTAGAMGQFFASPADLIKVQMQMEGRRRLEGKPPRVRNTYHAFKKNIQQGGVLGLWRGCIPNVQRAALVNLGDLATYDTAKRQILKRTSLEDNWLTHGLSSVCSGFMGAVFGTPADVIKTRFMNQPVDARGRGQLYKSSIDCLKKTVSNEGFIALYKGFIPIWSRMAPWSLTFWLTYEHLRSMFGTNSF